MKFQIVFVIILVCDCLFGQDTTEVFRTYEGYRTCIIKTTNDTLEESYYPNGKLLSRTKAYPSSAPYVRINFYPNGKKMYSMSFLKGVPEGPMVIYDRNGSKVMTLHFDDGKISDTLVHTTKYTALVGIYTYTSTVYGGVENEDGSSNISEVHGPGSFANFKLKSSKEKNNTEFVTDRYGWFVSLLPRTENHYCVVPKYFETFVEQQINWCTESPISIFNNSGSDSWSISEPIKTGALTSLIYTEINSNSVGYAP